MNFIATQKPLIFILNIFGFFSFKFTNEGISNYHNYRVIFVCVVKNLLNQFSFLYVHYYFTNNVKGFLEDETEVTKMALWLQAVVQEFCSLVIFYTRLASRGLQIKFFEHLFAIEMKVELLQFSTLNAKMFNQKMRSKCCIYCSTMIGLYTMILILYSNVLPDEQYYFYFFETINYTVVIIYAIFIAIFMDNVLTAIGFYFEEINKNLQNFIAVPGSNLFSFHEIEIRDLFQLHNELIQVIEHFNDTFGMIFVGIFVFTFGMMAFELYFGYTVIILSSHTVPFDFVNIITNIFCYIPLFVIVSKVGFSCESVHEKVSLQKIRIHYYLYSFSFLGQRNRTNIKKLFTLFTFIMLQTEG